MKNYVRFCSVLLVILILSVCAFPVCGMAESRPDILIGIAWGANPDSKVYPYVTETLDDMNIAYVRLDQVMLDTIPYAGTQVSDECTAKEGYLLEEYADKVKANTFEKSNVAYVLENIDGVIFMGGEDISPTLYKNPEAWHGIEEEIDYNAARDISDYILASYCIEQDIPVLGICRGAQVLGVCSGAAMIQDIPTWFDDQGIQYDNTHRNVKATPDSPRDFASHTVEITDKNSFLYDIVGDTVLEGAPSWHHQNILSVDGTNLKVVGVTKTCGLDMIEAVQRTDKSFILGIQFHPEAAVAKNIHGEENASAYMSKEQAEEFFARFYEAAAAEDMAA